MPCDPWHNPRSTRTASSPTCACLGIDGTQFDLLNTPQIKAAVTKAATRRGEAAFGKPSLSVLVELGTHALLGAALVRVRDKLNNKVRQAHADGSATVGLTLREVRGRVLRGSDGKWVQVRLWTSLNPQLVGAEQLLQLYARRWEQEIFYKELKLEVN